MILDLIKRPAERGSALFYGVVGIRFLIFILHDHKITTCSSSMWIFPFMFLQVNLFLLFSFFRLIFLFMVFVKATFFSYCFNWHYFSCPSKWDFSFMALFQVLIFIYIYTKVVLEIMLPQQNYENYFIIQMHWKWFYYRKNMKLILLRKCIGNEFTAHMLWKIFYNRNAVEIVLIQKCLKNYLKNYYL